MRKDKIAIIVGAIVALVVAATAFAARQTSSLSLVVLSSEATPAAAAAPEPTQGGQITFNVSTTQTDHPSVNVRCYQDAAWVYDGWQSFWPGAASHDPVFTLSSNYWTSGGADCTARLVYYDKRGLPHTAASMDFSVAG